MLHDIMISDCNFAAKIMIPDLRNEVKGLIKDDKYFEHTYGL